MTVLLKGEEYDDFEFKYLSDATADNGCSVTFMGEFWYFGDDTKVSCILYRNNIEMISGQ